MKKNDIKFVDAAGVTTFDESIKGWSFEQLKATYEGRLDYIGLAKQLGISPTKLSKQKDPDTSGEPKKDK